MKYSRLFALILPALSLVACASNGNRAPVVERGKANYSVPGNSRSNAVQHEKDWRPEVHVVQKGDTLYSIAFNYGFDYHELAELNRIADPGLISIGQEIHLFNGRASTGYVVESVQPKPSEILIKEQPKLVKYAYSVAAMAQIEKVQEQKIETVDIVKAEPKTRLEVKPIPILRDTEVNDNELGWITPTEGKVISEFSESANRKGIDIAGTLGQPVYASAAGKVVYSGNGLRGYGKLVIIKHNKTFLSAYAHNDSILVKEGESVTRGQKIAAMGKTDSDRVKLHFEVRRLGKPVDPAKYLLVEKS